MAILFEILGWTGTALIVYAYFSVSRGKLKFDQPCFQWLNLIGSVGIAFNVFAKKAWPAFTLEIVWASIASVMLYNIAKKARH